MRRLDRRVPKELLLLRRKVLARHLHLHFALRLRQARVLLDHVEAQSVVCYRCRAALAASQRRQVETCGILGIWRLKLERFLGTPKRN